MARPGFAVHWSRMGTGTVWTGIETDQLLLDFPLATWNKPVFRQ